LEVVEKRLRPYWSLLAGAGVVVAVDQWTKHLVRTNLAFGEVWGAPIPIIPFFRIVHWRNTGAAFGLFPDGGLVFTIVAGLVTVAILYYFPRIPAGHALLRAALTLQLGGAIGNLIDRILRGPVTDFLSVGEFPVFNVADACISTGVALLLLTMWLEDRQTPEQEGAPTAAEAEEVAAEAEHFMG
jgi:signal peptidase II